MQQPLTITGILLSMVLLMAWHPWQQRHFQAHMRIRSAQSGVLSTVEADVYYALNGRMVTDYTSPAVLTVIANRSGEVQVYNPQTHTVFQQNNLAFSTENSQLYFFLQNRAYDLGLSAMGFRSTNTRFENGLMVTEWTPPAAAAGQLSLVKLVHEGPNPIYVEYVNTDGQVAKKIYFYNYHPVGSQQFPQSMTQIDYFADADSLLTKTEFTDFKLGDAVDAARLNFTVPADARLISPSPE